MLRFLNIEVVFNVFKIVPWSLITPTPQTENSFKLDIRKLFIIYTKNNFVYLRTERTGCFGKDKDIILGDVIINPSGNTSWNLNFSTKLITYPGDITVWRQNLKRKQISKVKLSVKMLHDISQNKRTKDVYKNVGQGCN